MASQIPTKEDLGPTPTSRSGEITVQPAQNYVPQAVERLGQSIGQAGADVSYVERNRELIKNQLDAHENLAKASDIIAQQGDENDAAVHNMAPGGVGLLDQQAKSWKTKVDALRQTVPADKWPVLENYLTKQGAIQANQLRNQVYPEQDRFYGAKQDVTTSQQLDQIRRNPSDVNAQSMARTALEASIDSNPYLTPRAKEFRKAQLPGQVAAAHTAGTLADPQQSQHILDDQAPAKGLLSNNPGNLKYFSGSEKKYQGVVGPSAQIDQGTPQVQFASGEAGMQAAGQLALQKFDGGLKTVNEIIADHTNGWTPDNMSAAGAIARRMGVDVNTPLNLRNKGQLQYFLKAVVQQEQSDPQAARYPDTLYAKGAELALAGGKPDLQAGPGYSGAVAASMDHPPSGPSGPQASPEMVHQYGQPGTADWERQNLVAVTAGNGQTWQVNKQLAPRFQGLLRDLEAEGYDPKSSGGYNYRTIRGSGKLSAHAFGAAIDIGAAANPMGYGPTRTDMPANISEIAAKNGLIWGGDWTHRKDPMHFEVAGFTPGTSAAPRLYRPDDFADGGRARAADWVRRNNPDAPPEIVDRLAGEIVTNLNREDHVTAQDRAALTQMVASDKASISTTGQEVPGLTEDKVAAALGRDQANNWMEDRVQAHRFYAATNDMAQLTPNDMAQRLAQLEPQPGSPRYVQEAKTYKDANDIATQIKASRITDPAAAVGNFPAVSSAMQGASYAQPATIKALVGARLAAQAAIGIPTSAQSPITVNEARQLGAPFLNALPGQERPALEQLVNQLDATFGDQAPAAMRSILQTTKVDKDTSALIGALLQKVGKGQPVSQEHGEAVDRALTNQAADAASSPFLPSQSERVEASSGAQPTARPGQRGFGPFPGRSGGKLVDRPAQQATAPGKKVPSDEEIADLQNHPEKAGAVDAFFGPGTAAYYLGGRVAGARATAQSAFDAGLNQLNFSTVKAPPDAPAKAGVNRGRPGFLVPLPAPTRHRVRDTSGDVPQPDVPLGAPTPAPDIPAAPQTSRQPGLMEGLFGGRFGEQPNRRSPPAVAPPPEPRKKAPATRRRARNTSGIVPQPDIPKK